MTSGIALSELHFPDQTLIWRDRGAWFPVLEGWLKPFMYRQRFRELVKSGPLEHPEDDTEWLDILSSVSRIDARDIAENYLANALLDVQLRAYHGCRIEDAGVLHNDGLVVNDPTALAARARQLVMEHESLSWLRAEIDQKISEFEYRDRDVGRLHVVADERGQLGDAGAGHYCLYGSEWMQVLLGWGAHDVLRSVGVPTMVELKLPLNIVADWEREQFALVLLQEWIHAAVNRPDWVRELDFTFTLRQNVPPDWVIGHRHPARLYDPFHRVWRRSEATTCPHCAPA